MPAFSAWEKTPGNPGKPVVSLRSGWAEQLRRSRGAPLERTVLRCLDACARRAEDLQLLKTNGVVVKTGNVTQGRVVVGLLRHLG